MSLAGARAALELLAAGVPATEGRITLEIDGDLVWLRLDNPGAANALTAGMMVDLARAVERLATWSGRCVVLAAAGDGAFCAGGHLRQVQEALSAPAQGRRMSLAMATVLDALLDLPLVSVAAADGPAIGGGAELLTACDFRVLRRDARVHFVQGRLGVAPGWGGATRLVRLVGRRAALRLLAGAVPVDAAEALALGLADAVTDGPATAGALDLLAPIRALPAAAVRAIKAQVAGAGDPEVQAERFAEVWGGPDHLAALQALLERTGRT